jgi:tRNA-specific 2-thiouridylase
MVGNERIVKGEIVNREGKILSTHKGIPFYTIGQRRGIGIRSAKPLYVIQLDAINNRIVVGEENDLKKREFYVEDVNWCLIPSERDSFDAMVQIRYKHSPAEASIIPIGEDKVKVEFKEAQRAIAPGQAAVFYRGDLLIGGGWIKGELGS